jgi:hypothetical protein
MTGITQGLCTSFKLDLLSGGHNFNTSNVARVANTQDQFYIALYSASVASLDPTVTAYTAVGEISGTGYTAGGQLLNITQVPSNVGTPTTTAFINFGTATWTNSTFNADGALIYNVSNNNRAVGVLNFGGTKSVVVGNFSVQFPIAGTGSAIVQIA